MGPFAGRIWDPWRHDDLGEGEPKKQRTGAGGRLRTGRGVGVWGSLGFRVQEVQEF